MPIILTVAGLISLLFLAPNAQFNTPWPSGVVPYVLAKDLPEVNRLDVKLAMQAWSKAGITFWNVSEETKSAKLIIAKSPNGECWAEPYSPFVTVHRLMLSEECPTSAAHEIGHSLGLPHEHQRLDAPLNMITNWHIWQGSIDLMQVLPFAVANGPAYSHDSVMHYGSPVFNKLDGSEIDTLMLPTEHDIKRVNWIYKNELSKGASE